LPNEALEILLKIYSDILRARVFPDECKNIEYSLTLKETKPM
jgi:hypothetical protein